MNEEPRCRRTIKTSGPLALSRRSTTVAAGRGSTAALTSANRPKKPRRSSGRRADWNVSRLTQAQVMSAWHARCPSRWRKPT